MDDIASFLSGAGPDVQQKAQAIADALRGKQAQADQTRSFGNLGLLTGDRVLSGFGKAQLQDAQQMEDGANTNAARSGQMLMQSLERQRAQANTDKAAAAGQADDVRAASQFDRTEARLAGNHRDQMGIDRARNALMAGKAAKTEGDGKMLPATTLEGLAGVDVAKGELDKLARSYADLGEGTRTAKAGAMLTNMLGLQSTDAAAYNADAVRTMQSVGKILEGGKLAAGDEVKYAKMLPKPGDPPDLVTRKIEGLKTMLDNWKSTTERTYAGGGYRVGPKGGQPPVPHVPAPKTLDDAPAMTPEQEDARIAELEAMVGK